MAEPLDQIPAGRIAERGDVGATDVAPTMTPELLALIAERNSLERRILKLSDDLAWVEEEMAALGYVSTPVADAAA